MLTNSLGSSPLRGGIGYYTPANPGEFFSPQSGAFEQESSRCSVVIHGATQIDLDCANRISSSGFVHGVSTTFVGAPEIAMLSLFYHSTLNHQRIY